MQGVNYPVFGVGSNGQEQMMYPEQEYDFGNASYVDEYPMMKNGGGLLSKTVSCSNCGWSWKAVEGGIDPLNCHKCGGVVKMQIGGTFLQPITAADISNFFSLFSVPQKLVTKAVTGKYQTPSEAMDIKNPYGAFATDAVLDPVNLVGAGLLGKMAKASTKTGLLSNAYKLNPYAFKPNAQSYYRGIGRSGVDDALEKGILRPPLNTPYGKDRLYMTETLGETNMYSKDLPTYKGDPFGGVDDEWIEVLPKDGKRYIAEIPKNKTNFVIENDIFDSGSGYSTIFPKLSDVKLYQQDWLKGYKPIRLPNKKSGGQHGKQPLEKKHGIKVTYKK
jgi:hypothetical protein